MGTIKLRKWDTVAYLKTDEDMVDVEYLRFMWPMRDFLISCGENVGKTGLLPKTTERAAQKEYRVVQQWETGDKHLIYAVGDFPSSVYGMRSEKL